MVDVITSGPSLYVTIGTVVSEKVTVPGCLSRIHWEDALLCGYQWWMRLLLDLLCISPSVQL
jgi:hypothetical protein